MKKCKEVFVCVCALVVNCYMFACEDTSGRDKVEPDARTNRDTGDAV